MTIEEFKSAVNSLGVDVQILNVNTAAFPGTRVPVSLFEQEIRDRPQQCLGFIESSAGIGKRVHAAKCKTMTIPRKIADRFIDQYHIQGSNNLGIAAFGIYHFDELLGVLSLGRHNRQVNNVIVLDRLCYKRGYKVINGTSKLLDLAVAWAAEDKYEKIISFSDNRLTAGKVYAATGFVKEVEYRSDYCYIDPEGNIHSKQSRKKSSTNCPDYLTEKQWAEACGLVRLWDGGKIRWSKPTGYVDQVRLDKSERCAKQHQSGAFKHSHIRGYFPSQKNNAPVYFSSSYELRCLYLLENNPSVISFERASAILVDDRWRNPDLKVTRTDGVFLYEIKPKVLLDHEAVQEQIYDTNRYASANNLGVCIWTEDDSELNGEKAIVAWAKSFMGDLLGDRSWSDRKAESIKRKTKRYYERNIKSKKVTVNCEFCNKSHEVLETTYTSNMKKNGRFICIYENGHIIGKREKSTVVPTELQCYLCKQTKPVEQFSKDSSRKHGYSSKCKECNRLNCLKRYRDKKNKG